MISEEGIQRTVLSVADGKKEFVTHAMEGLMTRDWYYKPRVYTEGDGLQVLVISIEKWSHKEIESLKGIRVRKAKEFFW